MSCNRHTPHPLISELAAPRSRSASPQPTTASGVSRGRALFDTPSPDNADKELGPRERRAPAKYSYYAASRSRSRSRSVSARRAYARSKKRQAASSNHDNDGNNNDNVGAGVEVDTSIGGSPLATNNLPPPSSEPRRGRKTRVVEPSQPCGGRTSARGQGGKARTSRQQDRSPTPGTSDIDPDELEALPLVSGKTPAGSQYTWEYKTVPHDVFIKYAATKLGSPHIEDLQACGTQNILEMLRVAEEDTTPQVGSSRRKAKIILLPHSIPKPKGGGWHQRQTPFQQQHSEPSQELRPVTGKRQSQGDSSGSSGSSKRARPSNDDDTATESESDNARPISPVLRVPLSRSVPISAPNQTKPLQPQSTFGILAPPPTRLGTPATILDSPPPQQSSLSLGNSSLPLVSDLQLPIRDSAHARLRAAVLEKAVKRLKAKILRDGDRDGNRERGRARDEDEDKDGDDGGEQDWQMVDMEDDEMEDKDEEMGHDEMDEPAALAQSQVGARAYPKTPAPQRTYKARCSYLTSAEGAVPPARPNSPSTDPTTLIAIERARSVLEHIRTERESRAALPHRRRTPLANPATFTSSSTSAQAGSAPSRTKHTQDNRRLDPVSAARADMVAFNEDVAQGRARSFVESTTRVNRRPNNEELGSRCGPVHDRPPHGLVEDNEEDIAAAQAFAEGTYPKPARSRRRRNRKKKPLARDSTGLARQILVVAKVHLFAYALLEGIYQTRSTFMKWAELIHEKTWELLLPDLPYEAATMAELEVMVNYLATLRGKAKERLRPLVAEIHELQHRVASQHDIQENLDAFNEAHPNSFHCASMSPRHGHYESPHIGRAIGACLAYGPTSVIVQFPDYFDPLPITVVAFILALWQFCLGEWSNGYFESRELGTSHMLDKYEAHLMGLKELRVIAPRRFARLQDEWTQYVKDYSGASFVRTRGGQAVTNRLELRPDSPIPGSDVEVDDYEEQEQRFTQECEDRMVEEARIASLASQEAYLRGFVNDLRTPTPHGSLRAPPPSPAAEYDEEGRLTACSKGKGRAN